MHENRQIRTQLFPLGLCLVQYVGYKRWVLARRSNNTGWGALSSLFATQLGVYPTLGMSTELFTSLSFAGQISERTFASVVG